MSSKKHYTLGLDIGIASVGAALLAENCILGLHVRTFDKAETPDGESPNKIRRDARLTRRRIRRRAFRLLRLRRLLKRGGLIVDTAPEALATTAANPWQWRAEGLDRALTNAEWAAVLYHLVKHRGFQSNRKSEAQADEKIGAMLSGVHANRDLLRQSGYRTLGELLHKHERFAQAKRNKAAGYSHTLARADLAEELHLLFARQRDWGNPHADEALEEQVHALLMARKPTLSGEDLLEKVGKCTFEPAEYRAPKASFTAERFVWLTRLNNLRISKKGEIHPPTPEQRQQLLDLPFVQKTKLTYKQVRKALKLEEQSHFLGLRYSLDKDPESAVLFEAKAFHALRKVYENHGLSLEWQRDSQNPGRLDTLAYAMTLYKEDDEARAWLQAQGIENPIIEAILHVSFEQFVHLSLKALCRIVPRMEQGMRFDEAAAREYGHHSQLGHGVKTKYLPALDEESLTNPVVRKAFRQTRKLVNAIIREYGSPAAVHVEMARDLNKSFDERRSIERDQEKYRKTKESDMQSFEALFGHLPKGLDLAKWRLFREQDDQCAYSLRPFDPNRLFEVGYAEIDHALPYSRSYDDGMNNKVLVFAKENREKGNRTPYEYLGGAQDSERWRQFEAWVTSNPKYRQAKRNRLLRKNFGQEEASEFRERNLNDTRYACRLLKNHVENYLALADGLDKRVVVVAGQLTAFLRARWGLLKVREDGDLHHALDAAAVAACTHSMVKRLADYARREEMETLKTIHPDPETGEIQDIQAIRQLEKEFPQPWLGFRRELLARLSPNPGTKMPELAEVEPVRVSRAPRRLGTGQAHQETIRSAKWLENQQSSVKTPLTKLRLKDLPNIVGHGDPRNESLLEAIEQRLRAHGGDGAKAFAEPLYKPSHGDRQGPVVHAVKLLATQKSGLPVRQGIANNGDMVRADLYAKKGKFFLVPIYVADLIKEALPRRAAMANKPEESWPEMDETYAFQFSLYPNDWVRVSFKKGPPKEGYYAGLNRHTASISLWAHDRNPNVGKKGFFEGIGIKTALSVEKFHVDLLGRLHPVHPDPHMRLPTGG